MATVVKSFALRGVTAIPVNVEVDLLPRLPRTAIVGLPQSIIPETIERVRSAIVAAGFEYPRQRIVVNCSPADVPKNTGLDLAIAVGILVASGQLPETLLEKAYYGELALDGTVRPVQGVLAVRQAAGERLVVSTDASKVVTLVGLTWGVGNLADVRVLANPGLGTTPMIQPLPPTSTIAPPSSVDFADVRGNPTAVPGIVGAARTGAPLILVGAPGSGKSMMARRFTGLLPDLTWEERLEVATIREAAGLMGVEPTGLERPFRAPHHTVTSAGIIGDRRGRPGEATLAHKGVLFIDEAGEFPKATLDLVLTMHKLQSIRHMTVDPVVTLPANFRLILAVNDGPELQRLLSRFPQLPPESIVVYLETASGMDLLNGERWPTTAELRARVAS